jgi:hypothetical protein
MSIPAVTPPPVKMMPSRTTRPESCATPKSASLSRHAQWQAARLPRRSPAAASNNEPGAYRGDVTGLFAEPPDGVEISLILDGGHGAEASGNAEEVAFFDADRDVEGPRSA